MGRRLAELPALEAQGGDERQDPDPRRHRRRRQGRQDDRLRRQPALPDRLRVLQRRRARRPGPRPDVPQGHRRRRQGRRPRRASSAASTRPTRTTPSNSFVLDPGGALYFQEGTFHHTQVETPYGPPRALRQRGRLPLRAADAEVRRLRLLRLRQPARPRLRPLGPGHRRRRHRRRALPRRRSSPATSTIPTSTPARRRSTSSAPGPAPASRSSPAGTSPTRCRATCWSPT